MGLLDDLTVPPVRKTTCLLRDILSTVSNEEHLAILEAIEKVRTDERSARSKIYSNQWLADVLSDNGYTVSRSTVSRHINGECGCE